MKKIVKENYVEMSEYITDKIIEQIVNKANCTICIAGGSTPGMIFELLPKSLKEKNIDYSNVTFVSLDEWVGLDINTKGSCVETLYSKLFVNLELRNDQIKFFNGTALDLESECTLMDDFLESVNGLDLIVLGVGLNGHLGFNEPGVDENSYSQVVKLDNVTKKVMSKYFYDELPIEMGITLGMQHIYNANKVYVIANGENKMDIIYKGLNDKISNSNPLTLLRNIGNVELVIDKKANKE